MAQYESYYRNFFYSIAERIGRVRFKTFAEFTLTALDRDPATYSPLAEALRPLLTRYGAQMTATNAGKANTRTVGGSETQLRDYVRRVERKHISPNFDDNSTEYADLLPGGLSEFNDATQGGLSVAVARLLGKLPTYPAAVPAAAVQEGRDLLAAYDAALQARAQGEATEGERSTQLDQDTEQICEELLGIHGALLSKFKQIPLQARAFFDFDAVRYSGDSDEATPAQ